MTPLILVDLIGTTYDFLLSMYACVLSPDGFTSHANLQQNRINSTTVKVNVNEN